jgi:hypothetical protein
MSNILDLEHKDTWMLEVSEANPETFDKFMIISQLVKWRIPKVHKNETLRFIIFIATYVFLTDANLPIL